MDNIFPVNPPHPYFFELVSSLLYVQLISVCLRLPRPL